MARLGLAGPLALDTNCLNYLVVGQDPPRQSKMSAAVAESIPFGIQVATLALAELLVGPAKFGPERTDEMYRVITDSPLMQTVALDAEGARLAAEVRGGAGLKLPDAVVIACAVVGGADLLLSNDRRLVRVAGQYLRAVYFDDWEP